VDLSKAVDAHVQWKTKFRVAITKQESMDAATIGKDNCCELGKWLNGEGKSNHGSLASFKEVVVKHSDFHKSAGQIATAINAKQFSQADKMLASGTPFAITSAAVGVALARLKMDAKL
jgi:Chemoreceptor zinc-binding domain